MLKIGVLGAGHLGKIHIRLLLELNDKYEFIGFYDPSDANAEQAIEQFKTQHFDLVFMDIQMPNVDGIQACKAIKHINPNTPIVALTANVMANDVKKYMNEGFNSYIAKPVDVEELYRTINTYLN